jgi:hypothetical protein
MSSFYFFLLFIVIANGFKIRAPATRYRNLLCLHQPTISLNILKAVSIDDSSSHIDDDKSPQSSKSFNRIQDLQDKLGQSGRAGLLAYGILNCAYYISVTAIAWYVAITKYPLVIARSATFIQRAQFTVARLGSVAGTVWVGSQVTKIFRLSGAVAMAPFVDGIMAKFQERFKLPSRNAAFWLIVGILWASVAVFYSSLVLYGTSTLYMSALDSVL